jgi:hypothetical protein
VPASIESHEIALGIIPTERNIPCSLRAQVSTHVAFLLIAAVVEGGVVRARGPEMLRMTNLLFEPVGTHDYGSHIAA